MEIEESVSSNSLISYTLMFVLCLAVLTVFSGCATPLGSAAGKGDPNTVSTLIKSGADLDEKDIDGYTALHHAAMAGHTEVVRLLIENGADLKAERNGFIPLHSAAYRGQVNVVRILLASGSEVNVKTDFGHTPLLLAASHGHTDVVRILIENGADLNAKDVNGSTAIHNAAFYGHTAVVRILLDAGADPSPGVGLVALGARDTPLRLAQRKGYTAIVSMLQNTEQKRYEDHLKRKSQARNPTWVPAKWVKKGDKWHWNHGHYDPGTRSAQMRTTSITEANAPSWMHQKIQERGTVVIDSRLQQSRGRALAGANRLARHRVLSRLRDLVLDLRLDSQTTIRNVLTEDDLRLYTGITRNSYFVDRDSKDTIYTVTYGLNLNDVYLYMREKGIYYK